MKTTFYLVTTLIEYYDQPPTDTHALYSNFADAKSAMEAEIAEGIENFATDNGEVILDLDMVYEWRDEDGNGLTITIEKMNVKRHIGQCHSPRLRQLQAAGGAFFLHEPRRSRKRRKRNRSDHSFRTL